MTSKEVGVPPTATSFDRPGLLAIWRRSLTGDDTSDPTDVVVGELSEYFEMPTDEVRRRCIHWEDESVKEWNAKDRSTPNGLVEFYKTQVSWIFDTMWYHANQYHGTAPAESVEIALGLPQLKPGNHLDFGAGPGSSSLFFHNLGWNVSLADISTSMLDFARWRLERHSVAATFYDPSVDKLPDETFDLVTAFDVMVHVPDIPETLSNLHRALAPGGYFVFNIDNLPCTAKTQWHLYEDQYPILRYVRSAGFKRHPKITYFHVYQKVERDRRLVKLIQIYDVARYNRYVTLVGNQVRRVKRRLKLTNRTRW